MKGKLLYHNKITLTHSESFALAIAELKVWEIPVSKDYPEGIKFSLFLVMKETGELLLGFDNHKPKGPHQHIRTMEVPYPFKGTDQLIDDFWDFVKKEGFSV